MNRVALLFSGVITFAVSTAALATDPLGFYIGGSVGQADVRLDRSFTDTLNNFDEHHGAWKAMVGIRPLPILGAELEYLDFGNPSYTEVPFPGTPATVSGTVDTKAVALSGMLYAPIPIPFLDIYVKFGAARLHNAVNGRISGLFCPVGVADCGVIAANETETNLIYGAGMQFKFGAAAIQAEYERIDTSTANPDMVSLGLTWTF